MSYKNFIKQELSGWGRMERIIFPLEILFIIIISFIINDSKIALMSAICGICYTILAGKGKISCYYFGLAGTLCYSIISFLNQLYGNLALYLLYYLPMQILGIFKWRKHLDKTKFEIVKSCLSVKSRMIYSALTVIGIIICYKLLLHFGDKSPIFDSVTSTMSIVGMVLTVKRCVEQWYVWFVVNGLSAIMWIEAYLNGSNCFATIIMWLTYFVLSIYFLQSWKKELASVSHCAKE